MDKPASQTVTAPPPAEVPRRPAPDTLQALVAHVAEQALDGLALRDLASAAVRETAALYGAECGMSELLPDEKYHMVAGTGWLHALAGRPLPYEADAKAQSQHTPRSPHATLVEDLQAEARFRPAAILLEKGVRSSVSAFIPFAGKPWGTFGIFSKEPRRFGPEDARFVEAMCQALATAVVRRHMATALDLRVRQQATLAHLGREALTRDLDDLLAVAAAETARTLDADFCKILELDRDGRLLVLRAGVGWREGLVGRATVPADTHSQAGYALRSDRAIVVDDLAAETRFEPAPLLLDHGVVSGMSVIIRGHSQPYGVLGVHSRHRRAFSEDDIDFLETVAALLGAAIERLRVQEELQRHRAHLEEVVADRTRQLAASNKELEAFSYSVSHDLRAPLRTITGYSTLLTTRHADALGPDALQMLASIHKNAERLGRLIDDLMDLSRVQQVDLVPVRVDLSALCARSLAAMAAAEPGRVVAVTVQPNMVTQGDARLLGMLVENLLGNAWKFTRRTAQPRITVARHGTEGGSVYSVKDNGAGFDMAYADKLFQPFQRLHHASEFEGTGIGLATVKRIVERHGGRIWAEGRPGDGATFYFTLGAGHHP